MRRILAAVVQTRQQRFGPGQVSPAAPAPASPAAGGSGSPAAHTSPRHGGRSGPDSARDAIAEPFRWIGYLPRRAAGDPARGPGHGGGVQHVVDPGLPASEAEVTR